MLSTLQAKYSPVCDVSLSPMLPPPTEDCDTHDDMDAFLDDGTVVFNFMNSNFLAM